MSLTIISAEFEAVKSLLINEFGKAITVYKGERGYLPGGEEKINDVDIIMTVVTRLEIHRLKQAIGEVDPKAFLNVQSTKEVKGGLIKRKAGHN